MARSHPEQISPTAHYTGYVWFAHGQSHEAFATTTGRRMYQALRVANLAAQTVRLPTLDGMLLARHRLIDLRLTEAIETGEVEQVVEVAAGLSPRGWRFARRYGDRLTYVEADLPGMLANKRRILAELGGESPHHRTAEVDALTDAGPTSIEAICATLDPSKGTAIITEGLINYFDRATVIGIWARFAAPRAVPDRPLSLRCEHPRRQRGCAGRSILVAALGVRARQGPHPLRLRGRGRSSTGAGGPARDAPRSSRPR
ncbi:MAG: class I SAM-dependent methyltransferase [Myxococcales bacterium]|nr:class I SAM-dependent methyltransferase [Myxococcales bacterium]